MAEEEERQGPCPTNDNGSLSGEPSIPAFGELPKPSVDSWLALRASLRPPPMTINHGDGRLRRSDLPSLDLAFPDQRHLHPV